jgi:hypothetical protein
MMKKTRKKTEGGIYTSSADAEPFIISDIDTRFSKWRTRNAGTHASHTFCFEYQTFMPIAFETSFASGTDMANPECRFLSRAPPTVHGNEESKF